MVVLSDIEISANTTQMPHEMIKHRTSLLPVAVHPTDAETIKNATVSLVVTPIPDKERLVTTDDFTIEKGPSSLLMKDRDLNRPLLFIKVRKGEELHLGGKLSPDKGSHVCTATYKYHIDPERLKVDRETFLKKEGADSREFDNFYYQKSYSVDEHGRPNWIDFQVESVGVIKSKELLKMANSYLRKTIDECPNGFIRGVKDMWPITMDVNPFLLLRKAVAPDVGATVNDLDPKAVIGGDTSETASEQTCAHD
jgi:hypothetical protein